jgi:hypothetical protein
MRGDITEAAVLSALARHGLSVAIPFGQDDPYDLIVETRDFRLVRVQCKTARLGRGGTLLFNSCSTDHGGGTRDYRGRADVFGVFCPALERVFIVPVEDTARYKTSLRLRPARNNQERRVRYADDYDIARWAEAHAPERAPEEPFAA